MQSEEIPIWSCESIAEAELLKSMLEAKGIRAMVDADDYAGLPLPTSGGVQLRVLAEDADKARSIIGGSERRK